MPPSPPLPRPLSSQPQPRPLLLPERPSPPPSPPRPQAPLVAAAPRPRALKPESTPDQRPPEPDAGASDLSRVRECIHYMPDCLKLTYMYIIGPEGRQSYQSPK